MSSAKCASSKQFLTQAYGESRFLWVEDKILIGKVVNFFNGEGQNVLVSNHRPFQRGAADKTGKINNIQGETACSWASEAFGQVATPRRREEEQWKPEDPPLDPSWQHDKEHFLIKLPWKILGGVNFRKVQIKFEKSEKTPW